MWSFYSNGLLYWRAFSEDYGELGFTRFGRIIEGRAGTIALGGVEKEALLGIFGKADEASFAVGVGSDLEIEFVEVHPSIGDVDADFGGVDGLGIVVGDGEVGGARAKSGVDFGDGFGIDGSGVRGRSGGENCEGENESEKGASGWHTLRVRQGVRGRSSWRGVRHCLKSSDSTRASRVASEPRRAALDWTAGAAVPTWARGTSVRLTRARIR